jgi:hypothetical protein
MQTVGDKETRDIALSSDKSVQVYTSDEDSCPAWIIVNSRVVNNQRDPYARWQGFDERKAKKAGKITEPAPAASRPAEVKEPQPILPKLRDPVKSNVNYKGNSAFIVCRQADGKYVLQPSSDGSEYGPVDVDVDFKQPRISPDGRIVRFGAACVLVSEDRKTSAPCPKSSPEYAVSEMFGMFTEVDPILNHITGKHTCDVHTYKVVAEVSANDQGPYSDFLPDQVVAHMSCALSAGSSGKYSDSEYCYTKLVGDKVKIASIFIPSRLTAVFEEAISPLVAAYKAAYDKHTLEYDFESKAPDGWNQAAWTYSLCGRFASARIRLRATIVALNTKVKEIIVTHDFPGLVPETCAAYGEVLRLKGELISTKGQQAAIEAEMKSVEGGVVRIEAELAALPAALAREIAEIRTGSIIGGLSQMLESDAAERSEAAAGVIRSRKTALTQRTSELAAKLSAINRQRRLIPKLISDLEDRLRAEVRDKKLAAFGGL